MKGKKKKQYYHNNIKKGYHIYNKTKGKIRKVYKIKED